MQTTKHGRLRKQQRGFTDFIIEIIEQYGRYEKAPGGATKIVVGRKERQEIIGELKYILQLLDKAKGTMIVAEDRILTIYK